MNTETKMMLIGHAGHGRTTAVQITAETKVFDREAMFQVEAQEFVPLREAAVIEPVYFPSGKERRKARRLQERKGRKKR